MVNNWLKKWKPIHLCWWFEKHGWKIPKYLIGGVAVLAQSGFRICTAPGDNADPDDTVDHTWAAKSTDVTGIAKETPIFVRFSVWADDNNSAEAIYTFYYNTVDDESTATQITTTSNVVRIVNDPENAIADGEVTDANLITVRDLESGEYIDASDNTTKLDLAENWAMEIQACIQFQADAGNGTDYYFYVYRAGVELTAYTKVPKITTAVAAGGPRGPLGHPLQGPFGGPI